MDSSSAQTDTTRHWTSTVRAGVAPPAVIACGGGGIPVYMHDGRYRTLDEVLMFYNESAERGAEAKYIANGIFIATKSEVTVKLEIQGPHPSIPCRMLHDVLEEVMEKAFQ